MPKHDLIESSDAQRWTRPDAYFEALARRRTARKARSPKPRTQPEAPRLLLSTLPFLAVISALAVLAAAIMIAAWPGNQPQPKPRTETREQGVAAKGWLQDAEREFHK
jgi:hypothetical protein